MHAKPIRTRSSAFSANRVGFLRPGFFAALVAAAVLPGTASAQKYRVDQSDPEARRNGAIALQCIRNPARFSQDREKFETYFTKFYFPEMTQSGAEALGRLGDMRYNLFKKFLWASDNEQLQQRLTELALADMVKIVGERNPPYHPAVRYNAVLLLGMLDEQYAREGSNPRPARPHPKANKALTTIVDLGINSSRFTPPVILGAVIGLERHAQLRESVPPDAVQSMTATLLKLINQSDPIQEMDRNTYAWLRLRAASALATLGSVGPNNSVHKAIIKLVSELKSIDDRCASAGLLKQLNYEGAKIDAPATTDPLFQLARDLGTAEAERAQKFQDAQLGFGGGYRGGFGGRRGEGGYYGGMDEPERFPRGHVLARLVDLRSALNTVKPLVPAETATRIDALLAAIKPVMDAAVDKDVVELRFTAAVDDMAEAIHRAVPPAGPPAESEAMF